MAQKLTFAPSFKRDYQKLPKAIQQKLEKQLHFLAENPKHPSLRIHRLGDSGLYWEFCIDRFYRGVFRIGEEGFELLFAGTHKLIDRWKD